MTLRKPWTVGVLVVWGVGCLDSHGLIEIADGTPREEARCDEGYVLGDNGFCHWEEVEDGFADEPEIDEFHGAPAAAVWSWNLAPESGGSCQYGDAYEPMVDQFDLVIESVGEGFSLFDEENNQYPCTMSSSDFRCEGVTGGTPLNADFDFYDATDRTVLTFEGSFTSSTVSGVFTRATGTFARQHFCGGSDCADLAWELGTDFEFPCTGLGDFGSEIADR